MKQSMNSGHRDLMAGAHQQRGDTDCDTKRTNARAHPVDPAG